MKTAHIPVDPTDRPQPPVEEILHGWRHLNDSAAALAGFSISCHPNYPHLVRVVGKTEILPAVTRGTPTYILGPRELVIEADGDPAMVVREDRAVVFHVRKNTLHYEVF